MEYYIKVLGAMGGWYSPDGEHAPYANARNAKHNARLYAARNAETVIAVFNTQEHMVYRICLAVEYEEMTKSE